MNPRPILIALGCALSVVAIAYFGGQHVFLTEPNPPFSTPAKAEKPTTDTKTTDPSTKAELKPTTESVISTSPSEYGSIEELLANASPEFRQKYAELWARAQAEAEQEAEQKAVLRRANPTPEDLQDMELDALSKRLAEWSTEAEASDARIYQSLVERGYLTEGEELNSETLGKAIERKREEREREVEEMKRNQQSMDEFMEAFKQDLIRWGLWDDEKNQPKTTQ